VLDPNNKELLYWVWDPITNNRLSIPWLSSSRVAVMVLFVEKLGTIYEKITGELCY